jgi:putative SOS response-associated peptidase YedK
VTQVRRGLVPSWAKDSAIGNRMINARAETFVVRPAFRVAIRKRRCLIPADGFSEWRERGGVRHTFASCSGAAPQE